MHYRVKNSNPLTGVVLGVICAVFLFGCEAPLELDGVDAQRQQPIQRTDRFQAAANNGEATVVVGNQGVLIHSQDNGASWQRQSFEAWPALIDVDACPNGNFVVLAYDRKIYVSKDNGATWEEKPIPTEETPQAIECAPDNRYWVVGSFTHIWMSNDEGASWNESTRDEDAIFTAVQFLDASTGYVMGEFGTALKTTDGGKNWEYMEPLPGEFYPQAMLFRDASEGWVTGLGGKVLHTKDGGQTWDEQSTNVVVPLYGITEVNNSLYAAGGEGTLLRLDGQQWVPLQHDKPLRLYIRAIAGVDKQLLVGGVNGVLHLIPLKDT